MRARRVLRLSPRISAAPFLPLTFQPFKLTILDYPEQFGLQFQGQSPDLIQKKGGAVGNFKSPQLNPQVRLVVLID
jgi:hypothetical protein